MIRIVVFVTLGISPNPVCTLVASHRMGALKALSSGQLYVVWVWILKFVVVGWGVFWGGDLGIHLNV